MLIENRQFEPTPIYIWRPVGVTVGISPRSLTSEN